MDKKEKIIEYVKEIYNPVAIVFSGSRASGSYSPMSDWDIYVFTDREFKWGFDTFEDQTLDITIEKYPISSDFIFDTKYHPEQFLEIVFDKSGGSVEEAILRTQKKYIDGPDHISENEYQRLKKIMARYIQKVESRKDVQGLSFYYLGIYYEVALRLWFQLQKKWPLSPHEAILHIKEKDPNFSNLLSNLSGSIDIETQLGAAKGIYNLLFKVDL